LAAAATQTQLCSGQLTPQVSQIPEFNAQFQSVQMVLTGRM
jgi:hypothetical protein